MKYKQWYIAAALALLVLAVVCLYQRQTTSTVRSGYTQAGVCDEWNELIAAKTNQKEISLSVDGKRLAKNDIQPYMADDRQLMIPVDTLRDVFLCNVGIYDHKTLKAYRNDRSIEAEENKEEIVINGEKEKITNALVFQGGSYYLSADVVAKGLDYEVEWDASANTSRFTDIRPEASKLPSAFDPRLYGLDAPVMNQGKLGTCWAFASVGALEAALLPEESWNFSVDHMSLNNGYTWGQDTGGEYTMAMAYLLSWKGPVREEDDPYGDGKTDTSLRAVKHVQEIQIIPSKDQSAIKRAVYLYGSVQTSIYCEVSGENSESSYYNNAQNAYCYIGTNKINHDTLIVGWDDGYAASNFRTQPEGNGAWLCMNSWGTGFGDGGYFWVSYYDSNVGIYNAAYTKIENTDNYDRIYQSDKCGWVGQLGYGNEEAYFANLYTANGEEVLEAVGFYATAPDTSYEVYVVNKVTGEADLTFQKKAASGSFSNAGYYTVKLDKPVLLSDGDRYAVIVYVRTPGSERPVAVEYTSKDGAVIANLSGNEGYISMKGTSWQSAQDKYKCNICLKAYTKEQ